MKYAEHLRQLASLGESQDGPALSLHLSHSSKQSTKVLSSLPAHALSDPSTLQSQAQQLYIPEPWATIGYQHVCVLVAGRKRDHQVAYTSQSQLVSTFLGKVVGAASSWCLPVLYVLLADLRYLAAVVSVVPGSSPYRFADSSSSGGQRESISYISGFTLPGRLCQNGQSSVLAMRNRSVSISPLQERTSGLISICRVNPANTSRRKGVYKIACLSMKCYFKVRPFSSLSSPNP